MRNSGEASAFASTEVKLWQRAWKVRFLIFANASALHRLKVEPCLADDARETLAQAVPPVRPLSANAWHDEVIRAVNRCRLRHVGL
jgi:hypothetical protein